MSESLWEKAKGWGLCSVSIAAALTVGVAASVPIGIYCYRWYKKKRKTDNFASQGPDRPPRREESLAEWSKRNGLD